MNTRAEELKYFMRAGMRIAREMNDKSLELARLAAGDDEAAIEAMVGYATVLIQEHGVSIDASVTALVGVYSKTPMWATKITERLKQELSNAD